jgi:predicted nucleic acid-binding protein
VRDRHLGLPVDAGEEHFVAAEVGAGAEPVDVLEHLLRHLAAVGVELHDALVLAVPVTPEVIEAYVTLSVDCQKIGHALCQKIHTADRWVAATALALDRPLISLDTVYRGVPGLTLACPEIDPAASSLSRCQSRDGWRGDGS